MIDMCGGNLEVRQNAMAMEARATGLLNIFKEAQGIKGNYRMCERPSNPINYIKTFGIGKIFRMIVTHPDMDHMDGLNALHNEIGFQNFWDTGARREAPDFKNFYRYKEEDWIKYQQLINAKVDGVTTLKKLAGAKFAYANEQGKDGGHDGLYILAPNEELLCDPDVNDDINEASYVIQYCSAAGNIIFGGDAHDKSWEFVIKTNPDLKNNCAILLAPHHGRHSDRDYSFLDFLKPKITILGCSPSKYIDYSQWSRRNLEILTSNQAGNIVINTFDDGCNIYIENEKFAQDHGVAGLTNEQGYHFYKTIKKN